MRPITSLLTVASIGAACAFTTPVSTAPQVSSRTALNVASPGPRWGGGQQQKQRQTKKKEGGDSSFQSFFDGFQLTPLEAKEKEVIIDPDYKLAWIFIFSAMWICLFYPDKSCFAADVTQICPPTWWAGLSAFLHLWFGLFLADRAFRIRLVFDDKCFQMKNYYDQSFPNRKLDPMTDRPMNYVVGGINKWRYDKFVNWEFFPTVDLPVLVYFKETETPESKWKIGPGKYDYRRNGMVHFFPAFGNSYQIKREFEKRGLSKIKGKGANKK